MIPATVCDVCHRGMHYREPTWHHAGPERCACECGDAPHPSEEWDAIAVSVFLPIRAATWARYTRRYPPGTPGGTPEPVREVRGRRFWRATEVARWAPPQGWRRNKHKQRRAS